MKEEYIDNKSKGNIVACPVVLYVKKDDYKITVKKHNFPEDGTNYGRSLHRFFPENIREIISEEINYTDTDTDLQY